MKNLILFENYTVDTIKLKDVPDHKFEDGWGFVENIINTGFLAYNSGGQKDLGAGDVLNLNMMDKLEEIYKVDPAIVMRLQANYINKARKVTKEDFKDLDQVIIVNHNLDSVTIIKKKKKQDGETR